MNLKKCLKNSNNGLYIDYLFCDLKKIKNDILKFNKVNNVDIIKIVHSYELKRTDAGYDLIKDGEVYSYNPYPDLEY